MPGEWRPDKTVLSEADRELLANVERYGWSFMYVSPRMGDPEPHVFWGYTIGVFRTWQHPDLILFGPPAEATHAVLSKAVELVAGGQALEPGREYERILEAHGCRFLDVDPRWYGAFLGSAQWYYETAGGFPVRQLVLPDVEGHYPWEKGYGIRRGAQPLLISDAEARTLGFS